MYTGVLLNIALFVAVGFVAQMIDGALGMAYGVSSTTFLLSLGVSPAVASATVHTAEVFTTGVSGLSHFRLGNIDKEVWKRLVIPGVIGGIVGAYVLSSIPADSIKPFVSAYLLIMGLVILIKALWKTKDLNVRAGLIPLALIGGLLDAVGGGGWGPVVTTTLVAGGENPRYSIGSVNASEFFVTFAESLTFALTIPGLLGDNWQSIIGLLAGGVIAAPLAAVVCKRLPTRALMILVGTLIILLSIRTIYLAMT
jgi:uncharacterized membrane protein YfcA